MHGDASWTKRESRIVSLDCARGIAIVLMMFSHYYRRFVGVRDDSLLSMMSTFASFFCVPLFYLVSGYCTYLSSLRRRSYGFSHRDMVLQNMFRGILMCAVGMAVTVIQVGYGRVFHWSTLQMIGAGCVLVALVYDWKISSKIVLCILFLGISVFLQKYYREFRYWGGWNLRKAVMGALFSGGYPIFPWATVFITGAVFSEIKGAVSSKYSQLASGALFLSGLLLSFIVPVVKYPASVTYMLIYVGLGNLTIGLLDAMKLEGGSGCAPSFARIWGKLSLTFFVAHIFLAKLLYFLIRHLLTTINVRIVAFWCAFFVSAGVFWIVGLVWEKSGFRFSIEWALNNLSRSVLGNRNSQLSQACP